MAVFKERGAHREMGNFGGVEVVRGCEDHHDQAEGQDGFHAPGLAVGNLCGELVCTASNCCESERVNLQVVEFASPLQSRSEIY